MLFNSFGFLFAFLPAVAGVWFATRRWRAIGNLWLVLASLFFYGWWDPRYVVLLVASIAVNFAVGRWLVSARGGRAGRGAVLAAGVAFDLGLLGYYKYADFFVANLDSLIGAGWALPGVVLPLGISFFTFTQIAFLVDAWRGEAREYDAVNYALFVTFFPHLLAGPILHHKEMMPQFAVADRQRVNWENVARGLALLIIGLAKKVLIADTLAPWADAGFASPAQLGFADAWIASLAYTFQLYFDFSGYTDMALGMALMLNIRMPQNFDVPYAATSIRAFWRRWHMTLSRFLRDYLYIPLGGNRHGEIRTTTAILVTFFLGGLWHGANWTFVVWGILHGAALVVQRSWSRLGRPLPGPLAWMLTFAFVHLAWVFFRAATLDDAAQIAGTLLGMRGVDLTLNIEAWSWLAAPRPTQGPALGAWWSAWNTALVLLAAFPIAMAGRSALAVASSMPLTLPRALAFSALALASVLGLQRVSEFLYFNF